MNASAVIDATIRRSVARATAAGLAITLLFAAPSTLRLLAGQLGPSEAELGRAIASALSGITLPLACAAIAASVLGARSRVRLREDRLVAAGLAPTTSARRLIALVLVAAFAAAALGGALTIVLLRVALRLRAPGLVVYDALATAWAAGLGALAWAGIAGAAIVRTGRAPRAFALVVILDLVSRLLPGALAWIAPSAHVANLLGAPPPRGFVHVPVLPQEASLVFLSIVAAGLALLTVRRYAGAPRA